MTHFSRRTKLFLAFFVIVFGGYFASRLGLSSSTGIPQEFVNARLEGALIAQDIVNLSNRLRNDLDAVNGLDQDDRHSQALDLTISIIEQGRDIRSRATGLSTEIERMTRALSDIKSFEARQAALESIASRLAMINRLITYSDYLGRLLVTLQARFSGADDGREEVAILIQQINAEVTAINSFNNQAGQAMDRFDRIIR